MLQESNRSFALWWDESDVDVGENTTGSDGGILEKSGELLVVSDGQLDVSWDDSGLLVVLGGVTGELENLGGEVLKDGSEVDWGTGSNSLGVSSLLQESGDSSDWELKSGSHGSGLGSSGTRLSFTSSSFGW